MKLLKELFSGLIKIEQDFSKLTDEQLQMGYIDCLLYIEHNKKIYSKDKMEIYEHSLSLLKKELFKRGITKLTVKRQGPGGTFTEEMELS